MAKALFQNLHRNIQASFGIIQFGYTISILIIAGLKLIASKKVIPWGRYRWLIVGLFFGRG